jgi:hypothetical protein
MTLVNRKQISLYDEAEAGLNSLVKQTAQVGVGLLGMLLLTGGNPPALTVGLSVVGGIAFVAWSEEKRLTKFYAQQARLKHNPVIASDNNRAQLPNHNESELPELMKERLRQARYSYNAALTAAVLSSSLIIIGIVLLFSGKVTEGTVTISSGLGASIGSLRLAKNGKDRLDRITKELIDDSD